MVDIYSDISLIEKIAQKIHPIISCPPRNEPLRCFIFQDLNCRWQGVIFEDGYVCIRGKTMDNRFVIHQYQNVDEMLHIRDMKHNDIRWVEGEKRER